MFSGKITCIGLLLIFVSSISSGIIYLAQSNQKVVIDIVEKEEYNTTKIPNDMVLYQRPAIKDLKIGEKGWMMSYRLYVDLDKRAYISKNEILYSMDTEIRVHDYIIVSRKEEGYAIEIHGNHKFQVANIDFKRNLFPVVQIDFIK